MFGSPNRVSRMLCYIFIPLIQVQEFEFENLFLPQIISHKNMGIENPSY